MSDAGITYDVFLSYNWREHATVEVVARALRDHGLRVFLDRWYLVPGRPWPQALEGTLDTCRAVVVFLGPNGMGPWQQREKDLALDRQARTPDFSVIPVLLPNADPALGFLSLNTWVDLRAGLDDPLPLAVLIAAVRGEPPGPDLQERLTATLATVCPYRGLRPFREEDAPFFFGREAFTARLAEAVTQHTLVAVVGASGSGKSSVVRAGLVPHLRRGDSGRVWDIATLVPGDRPLHALAAALLPLLEPEMTETDRLAEMRKLASYLAEGHVTLRDMVARALEKQPGTDRLLLVVDQWEELYTLSREEQVRRRFLDEVLEATAVGSLSVVLTLRGDFFGHALGYRPLTDRLQNAVVNLGPMTREELERAVEAPVQKVGLTFETGLAGRMLDSVGEEPGNLPLLEFALTELWEARHGGQLLHAAYEAMGEVQGAIARRAEDVFKKLTPLEQDAARRVFMQLVRPGEQTEDTRRRATFSEVGEAVRPVVQRLADARLVVTGHDQATHEETLEVAHEALIRTWARLRGWLDEDREFLLWRQRLRADLADWERTGRDEGPLLRGAPLVEAERWLAARPDDLSLAERGFIQESVALRERERVARERSRHRLTRAAVAAAVVFLILAGLAGWQWRQANEQRQVALSRQWAAQALTYSDDQYDLALLLSVEAYRTAHTVEARSRLLTGLQRSSHLITYLRGHTSPVTSVTFSPDGHTLVSGSCGGVNRAGVCRQDEIRLWNVDTRESRSEPLSGHQDAVTSATLSPDGRTLAAGNADGTIMLWAVTTGQPPGQPLMGHRDAVTSMAFSSDGHTLASGGCAFAGMEVRGRRECGNSEIRLWDVDTRARRGEPFSDSFGWVTSVAFSPDGRTLASGGCGGVSRASVCIQGGIRLWNVDTPEPRRDLLIGHQDTVTSVAFSPDGHTLASGSSDGTIMLWPVTTGQPTGKLLIGHQRAVTSMAFSPDGRTLASGSQDKAIILWDTNEDKPLGKRLSGHQQAVTSVAFSPDHHTLVSGSRDNTIILWTAAARQPLGKGFSGHGQAMASVAFSPDGQMMALGGADGTIILWDVQKGQQRSEPFKGHQQAVTSLAFSSDGQTLASGSEDTTVILWDVQKGQRRSEPFGGYPQAVTSVAFSPDGHTLVSGSADPSIIILRTVATGQIIARPLIGPDRQDAVTSVTFSPDGHTLVLGSVDGTITLWEVATGKIGSQLFSGHQGAVTSMAFSRDGRTLALGGCGEGGKEVRRFRQCTRGDIRLWDMDTRQPIGQMLSDHQGAVTSVAFSPDGQTLASGSRDNTIILWDLRFESWRSLACDLVARNLTLEEWHQYLGKEPYRKTCPHLP